MLTGWPVNITRRTSRHAFAADFWSERYIRQIKYIFCVAVISLGQHYTTSGQNFSVLTSAPVNICIMITCQCNCYYPEHLLWILDSVRPFLLLVKLYRDVVNPAGSSFQALNKTPPPRENVPAGHEWHSWSVLMSRNSPGSQVKSTHTDRHTDTQTQTDTQTYIQTDRHRQKHTHIHTRDICTSWSVSMGTLTFADWNQLSFSIIGNKPLSN